MMMMMMMIIIIIIIIMSCSSKSYLKHNNDSSADLVPASVKEKYDSNTTATIASKSEFCLKRR
jgi:hypothetical protein